MGVTSIFSRSILLPNSSFDAHKTTCNLLTMASKATQEYRLSFITLISQLTEIERKGQELFDKIEKSIAVPYNANDAQADFEQLLVSLRALETHAKTCGLLSITGMPAGATTVESNVPPRNLATRNAETLQSVDEFFQEKNRLLMNLRAAVNTAKRSA
ncbi:uncharacterized protein BYT42DRAFT_584811 [Radiomyces spectabilis]|uniref:uncharacterized protein n=1 Tax=Radiomyces spectabilis TaxID=64574 RepID=UPI00221FB8A6|nr:uncharacterized protein BYT42DRAFT_584811 [Radiomyces spectabilis]KAI8369540.1 hypothetical protein BYT42DRAFT_584811 [Radiomyces spectabilis]